MPLSYFNSAAAALSSYFITLTAANIQLSCLHLLLISLTCIYSAAAAVAPSFHFTSLSAATIQHNLWSCPELLLSSPMPIPPTTILFTSRTFIRRLFDVLKSSNHRRGNVFIRLNKQAKSDVMWWHCFIEQWNGMSMMTEDRKSHPDASLTSDALGTWGCGAFWNSLWFHFKWPETFQGSHITIKKAAAHSHCCCHLE